MGYPTTLIEAVQYFSDAEVAHKFVVDLRWPNGVECPTCGSKHVRYIATRRLFECKTKHDRKQFSVKVGTIFEDSPLSIGKWLMAIWMEANAKNSISSYEVHRAIGVTQKTAWFMQQRIRLAMQSGTFTKLRGHVEVDETFIGGKARNMHYGKRKAKGRGAVGKAVAMGLLERHSEDSKVKTVVVKDTKRKSLRPQVLKHVEKGSNVYTDELASYKGLAPEYAHQVINHAEAYAKGEVHTNGLENYWSLFKRCIKGTHISVEPFHLFRYLDAEAFRFNNRKTTDGNRFVKVVESVGGKRLTYKGLIGEEPQDGLPQA